MTTHIDRLAFLLTKRLQQELSAGEAAELEEWAEQSDMYRQAEQELIDPQAFSAVLQSWNQWNDAAVARRLQDRFPDVNFVSSPAQPHYRAAHRIHFLKTAWVRYAAAVIILFGIGAYLWNTQQKDKPLITDTKPVPVKNDVAPGSTKATLTLSNGKTVELTPKTGVIAEAGTNIQNANGRLEYGKAEKVVFNTMSTPRGGQYQLTLPDGTNVWLNAASSITYPTAFVNNIREVTISGEAYFEVKKNAAKPFVVKTPKEAITVLGTSFNVNAYPEEPAIKTSLLEGSVKVANIIIKPGQAFFDGQVVSTNVAQDVAWKNGAFDFRNMDLATALRQLGRWYNVDIIYEGKVPSKKPWGEIGRDLKLSQALKSLESIGIRTRLEDNKLYVLPN